MRVRKMSRRASSSEFRKTGSRVHPKNVRPVPVRGGIRL